MIWHDTFDDGNINKYEQWYKTHDMRETNAIAEDNQDRKRQQTNEDYKTTSK